MASSRLRKAFHYPGDNGDDDDSDEQIPPNMDEEGDNNRPLYSLQAKTIHRTRKIYRSAEERKR